MGGRESRVGTRSVHLACTRKSDPGWLSDDGACLPITSALLYPLVTLLWLFSNRAGRLALILWLLRAAVASLAAATAAEAALVALSAQHREDAWQLPMLVALLWQAALKLGAAHAPGAAAAEQAAHAPQAPQAPLAPLGSPLRVKAE